MGLEEQQNTSSNIKSSQKSKKTKEVSIVLPYTDQLIQVSQQSKPLLMKQHVLNSTLNPNSRSPSPEPLTHVQEQVALRAETIQAFHTQTGDDEEGEDDEGQGTQCRSTDQ